MQLWIAMGDSGQHVLRSGRVAVLGVVEISHGDSMIKMARDRDQLRRRRVTRFRRCVELRVMTIKRDVAEYPCR